MKYYLSAFLLILLSAPSPAQETETKISLAEIMKGEEFIGYLPEAVSWSEDSRYVYFSWNPQHVSQLFQ